MIIVYLVRNYSNSEDATDIIGIFSTLDLANKINALEKGLSQVIEFELDSIQQLKRLEKDEFRKKGLIK